MLCKYMCLNGTKSVQYQGGIMWYIVQVAAGQEEAVSEKCRQAFPNESYHRIFVPKYMVLKRYLGQWHEEKKILFPGYFIVDADEGEVIREVLEHTLRRIAKPVCVGNDFVPVYPEEQKFLEALLDAQDTVGVSRGDIVNGEYDIKEGLLQKWAFCIRRVDRHKRLADIELLLHGEHKKRSGSTGSH